MKRIFMVFGIIAILLTGCTNETTTDLEKQTSSIEEINSIKEEIDKIDTTLIDDVHTEETMESDNSTTENEKDDLETQESSNTTETNTSDESIINKEILVGTWRDYPTISDADTEIYSFEEDDTFKYYTSQYEIDRELISLSGKWELNDNNLILSIDKKTLYNKELDEFKDIDLENPEIVTYSVKNYKATGLERFIYSIEIDGISYWKDELVPPEVQKKLNEVFQQKIEEFRINYSNMMKDLTKKTVIDTFISANLLYYTSLEDADKELLAKSKPLIEEHLGFSSIVYTGLSDDFIHFIAIVQPQISHSFDFTDAINELANDKNEMDMISYIMDIEPVGYFALDLYAEDLLNQDSHKTFPISNIDVYYGDFINEKSCVEAITENIEDVNTYLSDYDRVMKTDYNLKTNSWNLFITDQIWSIPTEIVVDISGEKVKLTREFH